MVLHLFRPGDRRCALRGQGVLENHSVEYNSLLKEKVINEHRHI